MPLIALAWFMIAGAVLILVLSPFVSNPIFEAYKSAGVVAGVILSLAGHLFTQGRATRDTAEKDSKFYLDSAVLAFEEARKLLDDGNNYRLTWIAAARSLAHAQELSELVSADAHTRVLELHKLKYRAYFRSALTGRPPAFFYGASDDSLTIDKAAEESTAPTTSVTGRHISSTLTSLPEVALRAVWKAAEWPTDYKDPLSGSFSDDDVGRMMVLYPELHQYLEHSRTWHSASGKLYRREKDRDS